MNKPIYEKNMEALEKKYPVWAKLLKEKKRKKANFDVIVEQSYTNETIIKISDHGNVYYLNGKYAPSRVADDWLKKQGTMDGFATIVIIGISNGVHIRKIMSQVPETVNILIYEPSYEIFRRTMEEVDLSFLFAPDIPVGIVIDEINQYEIPLYFRHMIAYDNLVSMKIYMSGNYQVLFHDKVEEFLHELNMYIRDIRVGWNTVVRYTDVNAKNVFHNLHYLYEGYSAADLQGILPEGVPVIIVSAGPSLNKNIQDLKAAVGKACIIATDTAMKPLLNEGIIPDLFMIVDGLKPAELFQHKDISKSGMVTMTAVSTDPMDIHKGRKIFYYSESPFETEMVRHINAMEDRNVLLPALPTGGSVATSAYSLGVYMGAKTVILVGQDLALTGNKGHVDGAFEDEKIEINMNSGDYLEVDAVDGGKVITRLDFKLYLDWFEKTIKEWKNIQTIDATEGGALIHGTKVMTLKKAIKKYCVCKYNTKWHISRIPKLFQTEEEKEYGLRFFENSGKEFGKVKRKAKQGIRYYEELEELIKKNNVDEKKVQKTYEKVKKINSYMETDAVAETVVDSLKGVEYALRPLIYREQKNKEDNIEEIAEQGKLMLSAIWYAADEIKKLAEENLESYVKKCHEDKTKI